jgi:hypothetical protein
MDGEQLEPLLPACAAALADGTISLGHIAEIRSTLAKAAAHADRQFCAELETILVRAATQVTPLTLREACEYALARINQDGDGPDMAAHRRGITLGRQDPDGLTRITGWVDAELAAYLKTMNEVWAPPESTNPPRTPGQQPTPNPLDNSDTPPQAGPHPDTTRHRDRHRPRACLRDRTAEPLNRRTARTAPNGRTG